MSDHNQIGLFQILGRVASWVGHEHLFEETVLFLAMGAVRPIVVSVGFLGFQTRSTVAERLVLFCVVMWTTDICWLLWCVVVMGCLSKSVLSQECWCCLEEVVGI